MHPPMILSFWANKSRAGKKFPRRVYVDGSGRVQSVRQTLTPNITN